MWKTCRQASAIWTSTRHRLKCLSLSETPEVVRTKAQKEERSSNEARHFIWPEIVGKIGTWVAWGHNITRNYGGSLSLPFVGRAPHKALVDFQASWDYCGWDGGKNSKRWKKILKNGWPQKKDDLLSLKGRALIWQPSALHGPFGPQCRGRGKGTNCRANPWESKTRDSLLGDKRQILRHSPLLPKARPHQKKRPFFFPLDQTKEAPKPPPGREGGLKAWVPTLHTGTQNPQ